MAPMRILELADFGGKRNRGDWQYGSTPNPLVMTKPKNAITVSTDKADIINTCDRVWKATRVAYSYIDFRMSGDIRFKRFKDSGLEQSAVLREGRAGCFAALGLDSLNPIHPERFSAEPAILHAQQDNVFDPSRPTRVAPTELMIQKNTDGVFYGVSVIRGYGNTEALRSRLGVIVTLQHENRHIAARFLDEGAP